jgi:hypothetical protein
VDVSAMGTVAHKESKGGVMIDNWIDVSLDYK